MGRKLGVNLKINVSNIEKARLYKGNKGVYLDATVYLDVDHKDPYGNNGIINQQVTKEERQSGTYGATLGNARIYVNGVHEADEQQKYQQPAQKPAQQQTPQEYVDDFDDDIPF